jgi:hypothetical protein
MNEYDEDSSIQNLISEYEIEVDRPVRHVWNSWLEIRSWFVTHDIVEVSEPRHTLGAIMRASLKSAKRRGLPLAHHHFWKIVMLVPERRYVFKTYAEVGGSYGHRFVGFYDTGFIDMGEKTKITFDSYTETRPVDAKNVDWGKRDQEREESGETMMTNLQNLKRIVESRTRK